MGIPGSLFFRPEPEDPFRMIRYGHVLETPVGVAAGPHTQLSQNIIAAWLCGARYIELKTIQTLDELEVSKPCIDMQDEGYNCEWSQELKIRESFTEYLNAWITIHVLHRELDFGGPCGTMFNMSVGYNLEGIRNDNVQWFFDRMLDCSEELAEAKNSIRRIYPDIDLVSIPSLISDHVTLSTMHGCPPGEVEKIGLYLIREKKLHIAVKLNPTLLGAIELRGLLNTRLGFTAEVPDAAFEHDLKYPDALNILESLSAAAVENGLQFGVKLTNTLESVNNKTVFGREEPMMYMSGRALHPVSIRLARKLQNDFRGLLDISFSGGADCFNIAETIACGLKPVTVCTDLLKPGGYCRLHQYIDLLKKEFAAMGAASIDEYVLQVAGSKAPPGLEVPQAALQNLNSYADRVAENPAYHKNKLADPSVKTSRPLGWFDCIHAPCTDTCPTNQEIPEYMHHTAAGNFAAAFETIFRTNPFPSVTGMVCDHLCQLKCTRINYDEPLRIREVKRFIAEACTGVSITAENLAGEGRRAAIIGAGPAGLSCAWFLRKAGFAVDVFEQKNLAGGMVSAAIPSFRLTSAAIETDIRRILESGVCLHDNYPVGKPEFDALMRDCDAVFLAAGAQQSVKLDMEGADAPGVLDPLEFLSAVKQNPQQSPGSHFVIIGGGNTAMDAARTAYRLAGEKGSVTIIYRRTIKEMPADHGEIKAVLDEGIKIMELTFPVRTVIADGHLTSIVCGHNMLSVKDKDGRGIPVAIPGSEFVIPCDILIPAIGQKLAFDFIDRALLVTEPGHYQTRVPGLFIGGDALRGASTAINAIADGRKAAMEIAPVAQGKRTEHRHTIRDLLHRKSTREYGISPAELPFDQRRNFDQVVGSLSAAEVKEEASRCLHCDEICNVCVSVCPNLANFSYAVEPVCHDLQKAILHEDGSIRFIPDLEFRTGQSLQILNIRDLCNECGNCTTFCPSGGRPFADKPGIHLSVKSLNDDENGFFLSRHSGMHVLIFKEKENIKTLTLADGQYIYETNQIRAVIRLEDFCLAEVSFLAPCVREAHFSFAAEMSIIMKGAMQLGLYDR